MYWWENFWGILGFLVIILISSPFFVAIYLQRYQAERRFARAKRAVDLFLSWSEVHDKLAQSKGTLIFEMTIGGLADDTRERVWWCDADLVLDAPCKLDSRIPDSHTSRRSDQSMYASECVGRYLAEAHSTGYLTNPPKILKRRWFDCFDFDELGQEQWVGKVNAITIVRWSSRNQCVVDIAKGEPATVAKWELQEKRISEYKMGTYRRTRDSDKELS